MANITEKISKIFPGVQVEGDNIPVLTVAEDKWHETALKLRDCEDLKMDYLVTIVGMDWKDSLGCIYYLMSTAFDQIIGVKVVARGDRQQPLIQSVADVWKVATLYEREVYDFFGIIFLDNPDMRRLFLNID